MFQPKLLHRIFGEKYTPKLVLRELINTGIMLLKNVVLLDHFLYLNNYVNMLLRDTTIIRFLQESILLYGFILAFPYGAANFAAVF